MSGSEKRLWPFEACGSCFWSSAAGATIEVEDEEEEGGQDEKCNSMSHSGLSMYSDWVLSVRRPGWSFLLKYFKAQFSGGVWGLETDCKRIPGGTLTVSGMTGRWRCSGRLEQVLEDLEVEEAQLDKEEAELAGVRFRRDTRPPGTLVCWDRFAGFGGQTGLYLFSWAPLCPER